uniref:Calponin-homology (CH) domain-containing protein n=1 Tax=Macrostomum lignano TaxID=282301 RepID=A0A1I8IZD5_9PLAT
PDLIDYNTLSKAQPVENLQNAFQVAEDRLGLAQLLDPEDVNVEHPDEKSVMTYVVTYYHYFSKVKEETVQAKRLKKVLAEAEHSDDLIAQYEKLTSDLLDWIEQTIELLNDRTLANSVSGVQAQLQSFSNYRTVEKPPKFTEKGNLEIQLFTIQQKMRANNQRPYFPKEEKMVSEINKAWERLEKAEHAREIALRDELIRQEKLEQLAARFDRKAGMRETWLAENQRLVSQDNFGHDLPAVEAATKKHEAIETDIFAYEERVNAVVRVAAELESENYRDTDRILARKDNLLDLLRARRMRLDLTLQQQLAMKPDPNLQVHKIYQEILYVLDWIEELTQRLQSEEYGRHLMGVDDLIEKHALLESDIQVLGDRVQAICTAAQAFIDGEFPDEIGDYRPTEPGEVEERSLILREAYEQLRLRAIERQDRLDESRALWMFMWEMEEAEQWTSATTSRPAQLLLGKHRATEDEISARRNLLQEQIVKGEQLAAENNMGSDDILSRIEYMNGQWDQLVDRAAARKARLLQKSTSAPISMAIAQALDYHRFLADCDETDAWLAEMQRLCENDDTGNNEQSVQSLQRKHEDLQEEIRNYKAEIDSLHSLADGLNEADRDSPTTKQRLESIDDKPPRGSSALTTPWRCTGCSTAPTKLEAWIREKKRLLASMLPSEEIEELEVVKHRFDGFEQELKANAERVAEIDDTGNHLQSVNHPNSEEIRERQDDLKAQWNELADLVDDRRDRINNAYDYNTYNIECRETANWIKEKCQLVESTDELGNDLGGIMQLQRRLQHLNTDMAAIEARLQHLDEQCEKLENVRPDEAEKLRAERDKLKDLWKELSEMREERRERLEESSELQKFLQDLDHFQCHVNGSVRTVSTGSDGMSGSRSVNGSVNVYSVDSQRVVSEVCSRREVYCRWYDWHRVRREVSTGQVSTGKDDVERRECRRHVAGLAVSTGGIVSTAVSTGSVDGNVDGKCRLGKAVVDGSVEGSVDESGSASVDMVGGWIDGKAKGIVSTGSVDGTGTVECRVNGFNGVRVVVAQRGSVDVNGSVTVVSTGGSVNGSVNGRVVVELAVSVSDWTSSRV